MKINRMLLAAAVVLVSRQAWAKGDAPALGQTIIGVTAPLAGAKIIQPFSTGVSQPVQALFQAITNAGIFTTQLNKLTAPEAGLYVHANQAVVGASLDGLADVPAMLGTSLDDLDEPQLARAAGSLDDITSSLKTYSGVSGRMEIEFHPALAAIKRAQAIIKAQRSWLETQAELDARLAAAR